MIRLRTVACHVAMVALVVSAACGNSKSSSVSSGTHGTTPADHAATKCTASGAALSIVANSVKFDKDCLAAPANQGFTIEFDNEDASIPHNLSIFSDSAMTKSVFKGDEFSGVAKKTYNVAALPVGTYHFHCDIHPTTMEGTLVVQ